MAAGQKFYITTAISYPNGEPHIGHAYEAIATDTIARFERCDGKDVYFLTGTDEHGLKMQQTAIKEGITPRELADKNSARFRDMVAALNLSHDDFIRTSEPRHYRSSEEIWRRMEAAGDIFKDKYAGWYSVRDEAFYSEDETEVGEDGVRRGPQGSPVEWTEEETYFFRLSAYQDRLLAHYEANPEFILPRERRNEVASFVKGGLQDLSISRATLDWGIPVPGSEDHVMYVWVDALTNYITGVGFPDEADSNWRYWPADVHVIGKDIVRFHAVYWPAFLMSAGIELPKRVFAHGFMLSRGEKMSKSIGNVIDPFALANEYGVDQIRYFFLRETTFGQDGNYSSEAITNRTNADLANDLGNLAQRSLSMIAKNCNGEVPTPGEFSAEDQAILAAADGIHATARTAMDRQAIKQYLDAVWNVVGETNRYFAGQEPWTKRKTDPERMATILYVTAEVVRQVAILAQPVVPTGAGKLLDLLAVPDGARTFSNLGAAGRLEAGRPLPKPQGVFPALCSAGNRWRLITGMLVDHHCHLDFPQFAEDRDAIVERAHQAGVGLMVTICTRVRNLDTLLDIAGAYPGVFCSVGTHPHYADQELDISAAQLVELSRHDKVVAIGEAGLDYHYQRSPREAQEQGFRTHIAAARETGLPLEIHAREADDDTARILEDEYAKGPFKAILHCYTGGADLARRAVAMGMTVSFTGVITFKKSDALRAVAADVPMDNLLVETDAPYLAPLPYRGKTNEPSYVCHTAQTLADVKGVTVEEIAAATTENFFRIFTKVPRAAAQERQAA